MTIVYEATRIQNIKMVIPLNLLTIISPQPFNGQISFATASVGKSGLLGILSDAICFVPHESQIEIHSLSFELLFLHLNCFNSITALNRVLHDHKNTVIEVLAVCQTLAKFILYSCILLHVSYSFSLL